MPDELGHDEVFRFTTEEQAEEFLAAIRKKKAVVTVASQSGDSSDRGMAAGLGLYVLILTGINGTHYFIKNIGLPSVRKLYDAFKKSDEPDAAPSDSASPPDGEPGDSASIGDSSSSKE